jgi:hypothetical protein
MQPLAYVLAPVLIFQGMTLRRRIPRLPEAAGPAGTASGLAPAVRLAYSATRPRQASARRATAMPWLAS